MAPPDFDARTLVDFPRLPAMLTLSWGPNGTTAPFSSQEPTGLVLDLANPDIGRLHVLTVGPRVLNLLDAAGVTQHRAAGQWTHGLPDRHARRVALVP